MSLEFHRKTLIIEPMLGLYICQLVYTVYINNNILTCFPVYSIQSHVTELAIIRLPTCNHKH